MITNSFTDEIFDQLIDLYKKHKSILGFFPLGAFVERRNKKEIFVFIDNNQLVGYLLFRTTKLEAIIVHLCVQPQGRRLGVAKKLINHLVENSRQYYGIGLHCRRDYVASKIWPSLGFIAQGDIQGRSYDGKLLTRWRIEHVHPDLFGTKYIQIDNKISIVIDSNIFFDFFDENSPDTDDSKALLADWIQEYIEIFITPELKNEINRQNDNEIRKKSHSQACRFVTLDNDLHKVDKIYNEILEFYSYKKRTSDHSDIRQLSHAIVNEFEYFITKDNKILSQEEIFFQKYSISILHPFEFISKIDQNIRVTDYQPSRVKASQFIKHKLTSDKMDIISSRFIVSKMKEKKSSFEAMVKLAISKPEIYDCIVIDDESGNLKAFVIIERSSIGILNVPIIRVFEDKYASTISRFIIHELISSSIKENRFITTIVDKYLDLHIKNALIDSSFTWHDDEWIKISMTLVNESEVLIKQLSSYSNELPKYKSFIETIKGIINVSKINSDVNLFSQIERILFPAKFTDFDIPGVIVPIKPYWAENLFDYKLAGESLFGAKPSAMLDFENVYYRSSRSMKTKLPARILWYVSDDKKYEESMQIRACSYLDDIIVDNPKILYRQFNRLGVYDWNNIYKLANNRIENKIMALKFSYSEIFENPIDWGKIQSILLSHNGKSNQIQSPVNIPHDVFIQIYKIGFNK